MTVLISTYPDVIPANTKVYIVSVNSSLLDVKSQTNKGNVGENLVSIENPFITFDMVKGKQEITISGNVKLVPTREITIVIQ